ncbi:MAG TPA: 23S rRNA (uracil(1939)-C(5))-methyltransferase RlmD [Cytophagaceae bacterium]
MSKKKPFFIENVCIQDIVAEGKCITRHENKVIFVENVAPGDIVDLKVFKSKKNFAEASVTKFHEYSKDRKEPFCQHFGTCGGCKWQHIAYEVQLKYKQKQVADALERIGKVKLPEISSILPSQATTYYRNKLEFTFSNKRWLTEDEIGSEETLQRNALGFHIPGRFDKILDITHCYLQPDPSNAIRLEVQKYALEKGLIYFDLKEQVGLLRNLIIRTASTGETMVIVQFFHEDEAIIPLMEHLKTTFPQITSLNYIVNPKKNETFHDQEVILFAGTPYITERMENLQYRIGPKSFYQTNSEQAYHLYKVTREFAGLTGEEVVYDLYTGTGTIANFVAAKAKKVIGIEYVEMAIEDAKVNSQINNINNTIFYAGDMKDILTADFVAKHEKPDVIITDPPRAGMHEDVCKVLLASGAKRIVYVSCNPATQARDIALLNEKYEVKKVQPVDMFPHTHHVENVVLLELR